MEFQSKWKRTPKFLALLAIFTTTLFVSLMLTGAKPVNAATKADEITVNSATPKEQAIAKELEKMFVDGDIENLNIDYLIAKYGKDEIQATERFIGISENESRIFPTEHRIVQRDLADIGNCMLGKLGEEIRSMVNVNTIVAYIDKKLWLEAAKAIVAKVAAQGIKRNAAVMATVLALYAVQCGLGW